VQLGTGAWIQARFNEHVQRHHFAGELLPEPPDPLMTSVRSAWQANNEDALPMMLSLYVTLGVFVCWQRITHRRIAAWSPSRHGRALFTPSLWRCRHCMMWAIADICWAAYFCLLSSLYHCSCSRQQS